MKKCILIFMVIVPFLQLLISQDCDEGYTNINGLCLYEGDLGVTIIYSNIPILSINLV